MVCLDIVLRPMWLSLVGALALILAQRAPISKKERKKNLVALTHTLALGLGVFGF